MLQPVDLTNQGGFYPRVINSALDRLTILLQQLASVVSRTLKFPLSDGPVGDLPGRSARAGTVLAFDEATGEPVAGPDISSVNGVAGALVAVNTVAGNIADVNTVATNIADVNAVGQNIADVNTVAGNIADVNTVAGNIADVNTVADNITDLSNFSGVYYGPSATDPTTRRDGSPLQVGDLYFSTITNAMRTYNGSAWRESVTGAITVQNLSGDGVETEFQLDYAPESEVITNVFVGGVYQQKNTYALGGPNGDVLIFDVAPPVGTGNIEVVVSSLVPSDDKLRQELAGEGGSSMIGRGVVAVESIADLLALPADQRRSDLRYLVASYHGGWGVEGPAGGGEFYYDSDLATENNGGTVIEGFVRILDGPVCPTMFGAKGDGVSDDGAAFQAVVDLFGDISVTRRTYNLGARALVIPRDKRLSFNDSKISRTGAGVILDLVDSLYTTVRDVTITVPAGCTGIRIDSTGALSSSQLNRFYNVNTEGSFSAGSVSLQLLETWTNQFYSCNFFRTQTGIVFGSTGMVGNSCNANHFYGCEVRSENTYAGHTPLIHYGGYNNAFFGGVIENWANSIDMQGGTFMLKGVYLEGFAAGHSIAQSGGRMSLDGCFRLGSANITGGLSFSLRDHHFVEPSGAATYHKDYPFIRVMGNIGVSVSVDVDVDPTKVFVIREGYYRDASSWVPRTAGVDKVRWHQPKFSARLASDLTGITGDGTAATVNFGNNMEFNDAGGLGTSGIFTAAVAGKYQFQTELFLIGCAVGDTIDLRVTTSSRQYQLYRQRVTTGMLDSSGRLIIGGVCFANLDAGHTAAATLTVSGQASKTVGILRGDATNAFSAFQGFKI
jgi:hypothetical protein